MRSGGRASHRHAVPAEVDNGQRAAANGPVAANGVAARDAAPAARRAAPRPPPCACRARRVDRVQHESHRVVAVQRLGLARCRGSAAACVPWRLSAGREHARDRLGPGGRAAARRGRRGAATPPPGPTAAERRARPAGRARGRSPGPRAGWRPAARPRGRRPAPPCVGILAQRLHQQRGRASRGAAGTPASRRAHARRTPPCARPRPPRPAEGTSASIASATCRSVGTSRTKVRRSSG